MPIWQAIGWPGIVIAIARTDGAEVGMTVIKGSIESFHTARVPPFALDCSRGRSGWRRSSELR